MTPNTPWTLTALSVCALMTAACASWRPASALAQPPQAVLPTEAELSCQLPILSETATQADLDAAYAQRGAALVDCDLARQAAVETLWRERRMVRDWLRSASRARR